MDGEKMIEAIRKHWWLIAALILGLVLRLIYLWQFSDSPLFDCPVGPDVEEYDAWARDIFAGRWVWHRVHIHAPFYPYVLAFIYWLTNMNYAVTRLIQTTLNLLAGVPIYLILRRWRPNPPVRTMGNHLADIFIVIWACYPPLIFHQCELTSEALLLPLLCLTVYFLHVAKGKVGNSRWASFALAGICAGLAVITHPTSLLFVLAEIGFLSVNGWREHHREPGENGSVGRALIPAVVFAAAAFIVIAPVCARNSSLAGEFTLIQQNAGFNFWLGNNPDSTGGCYLRPGEEWERFHADVEERAKREGIGKDAFLVRRALRHITSHPGSWLGLTIHKALAVFNYRELTAGADAEPIRCWTWFQRHTRWSFALLAIWGFFGLLTGVLNPEFRTRRRHFLILFLAFWTAQTLFVTSGRYRLPILLPLMVFAAHGIIFFIRHVRDSRMIPPMASAFAVAAAIVLLPNPPVDELRERAEADSIIGEAYLRSGNLDRAEKRLTAASAYFTNPRERLLNLLGMVAEKRGRIDEARRRYQAALKARPASPLSHMNLAVLASENGDETRAEALFQKALSLNPDDPLVLYNYAFHLQKRRRRRHAEDVYRHCLWKRPSHAKALNNLGVLLMEEGRFAEAVDMFETAARLDPDSAGKWKNLAAAKAALRMKNGSD